MTNLKPLKYIELEMDLVPNMYQQTIRQVTSKENIALHQNKQLTELLNWTKQHLDAYLTTAKVICKWKNIEPG